MCCDEDLDLPGDGLAVLILTICTCEDFWIFEIIMLTDMAFRALRSLEDATVAL